MRKSERIEGQIELLVYWHHSVEFGPQLAIFDDDNIKAAGGVYGVEMELQRDSYWYVRLGTVTGQESASGWTCTKEAFAGLPEIDLGASRQGRRNPSLQRGQLEREIFGSLYQELSAFLKSWNHQDDEEAAYAIRDISISPNRISSISRALTSTRRAYEIIEMRVLKYCSDPAWEGIWIPSDMVLAEFPVSIPVQLRLFSTENGSCCRCIVGSVLLKCF